MSNNNTNIISFVEVNKIKRKLFINNAMIGYLVMLEDGFWYYKNDTIYGVYSANDLQLIASFINDMNKSHTAHINEFMNKMQFKDDDEGGIALWEKEL